MILLSKQFIPGSTIGLTTLAIGTIAQLFFSARILVQWIMSEKEKKVVSPIIFWVFSIAGSYLFLVYGWMRKDFAIILGQLFSYYIYLWNLNLNEVWEKLHRSFKLILISTPILAIIGILIQETNAFSTLFKKENIPFLLLIYGSAGQIIFTLRFMYQFFYSKRIKRSVLPLMFWVLSIIGSSIIISYGFFRKDIVLVVGQSFGFIAYFRNIILYLNHKKKLLYDGK